MDVQYLKISRHQMDETFNMRVKNVYNYYEDKKQQ